MADEKVSFDGINKIITCDSTAYTIVVQTDIYSAWKRWMLESDNSKYPEAVRAIGGDPISEVLNLGSTFFLVNGWKIKPAEQNYVLNVDGNLYCEDGSPPFIQTDGSYNVQILVARSNLIDTIKLSSTAATEIWNSQLEGLYTAKEIMRLMAAALAGKISGAEGTNVKIRDLNDTTDRIDATVDSNGNRLSIIYDKD
jgi:hypothetical protein